MKKILKQILAELKSIKKLLIENNTSIELKNGNESAIKIVGKKNQELKDCRVKMNDNGSIHSIVMEQSNSKQ